MIVDMITFRIKTDRAQDFEKHNDEWVRRMRRARGFVTQILMRLGFAKASFSIFV